MSIIVFDKKNNGIDKDVICNWITREYKCNIYSAYKNENGDYCVQFTNCKGLPSGECVIYALCEFITDCVYTVKILYNMSFGSMIANNSL